MIEGTFLKYGVLGSVGVAAAELGMLRGRSTYANNGGFLGYVEGHYVN